MTMPNEAWVAQKIDWHSNHVKSVHGYTAGSTGTYDDSMTEDAGEGHMSNPVVPNSENGNRTIGYDSKKGDDPRVGYKQN